MQKSMIHSDHMVPLDTLEGFRIRPGFFDINGATALSDTHKVPLLANFCFMSLMQKNHLLF